MNKEEFKITHKEIDEIFAAALGTSQPEPSMTSPLDRYAQSQPALDKLKEMANGRGNDSRTMAAMGNRNGNQPQLGGNPLSGY